MSEFQGVNRKEAESWQNWREVDLSDDDGDLYHGFVRTRERMGPKHKFVKETQFCYQPSSPNAEVTSVRPYETVDPVLYASESNYVGNLVGVSYPDGRIQMVFVPLELKTSEGGVVKVNSSTNFFAIGGGKTPSNG